jgi:predicted membrane channel-forming protein YqfA (hemolysin III family)
MSGDYQVDAQRFWTGAGAIAVIAGLGAIVAQMILQTAFDTTLQAARPGDTPQDLSYFTTFLVAVVVALLAGGLLHLFLAGVPKGRSLWRLLAALFLLASAIPVTQLDTDGENKLFLLIIHVVVYLFTVPTMGGMIERVATRIEA